MREQFGSRGQKLCPRKISPGRNKYGGAGILQTLYLKLIAANKI